MLNLKKLFKGKKTKAPGVTYGFDPQTAAVVYVIVGGEKFFKSFPTASIKVASIFSLRGPFLLKAKDTFSMTNEGEKESNYPFLSIRNDGNGDFVIALNPYKFSTAEEPLNAPNDFLREFDAWKDWSVKLNNSVKKVPAP